MQSRHFGWSTTTTIAWNGFPHLVGCNLSIYGNILEPPPYGHNICLQAFTTLSWYQIPFKLNLAAEPIFTEISFLFSVSCGWHYLGDSKHLAECRLSSFKGKAHAACHMLMITLMQVVQFYKRRQVWLQCQGPIMAAQQLLSTLFSSLRRALSWAKQSRCWAGTCFVCRLPPRLIFQPLPCLHPLLSCSSYCCQYHT